MFVELHILQNFAPSNLNRDDTNAPKDCEFGGYRRARISSQALKRAMRMVFKDERLIPPEYLAARTKRLSEELTNRLVATGRGEVEAAAVVDAAIQGMGLKFASEKDPEAEKKTQYLLFLGEREIAGLASICRDYWDEFAAVSPTAADAGTSARAAKKASKASISKTARDALLSALDGGKSADLALFGRMLADLPEHNVEAASQVAHAISTNRVNTEFDFYTAVDDFKPDDTAGADMLGTVEFNSACFYRYANIDLDQLRRNLLDDADAARRALAAFLRAAVIAIPTGKQNSMAAQNPPSFVLAVVRERALWSLANAFLAPVAPGRDGDLVRQSTRRLDTYWGQLAGVYGTGDLRGAACVSLDAEALEHLGSHQVATLNELIERTLAAALAGNESVGLA